MAKKAVITISLVPESNEVANSHVCIKAKKERMRE